MYYTRSCERKKSVAKIFSDRKQKKKRSLWSQQGNFQHKVKVITVESHGKLWLSPLYLKVRVDCSCYVHTFKAMQAFFFYGVPTKLVRVNVWKFCPFRLSNIFFFLCVCDQILCLKEGGRRRLCFKSNTSFFFFPPSIHPGTKIRICLTKVGKGKPCQNQKKKKKAGRTLLL